MSVFDRRICSLGEGPLFHPRRQELYWFDILGRRLLSRHVATGASRETALFEMCSACGWVDEQRLVIASETGLWIYHIDDASFVRLVLLEADNAATRSNDGRVDPWGGFWVGTMGKRAQQRAGAIYRYYRGELRCLISSITIPNAICFAPDGQTAYFADTTRQMLFRSALDATGWPKGSPEPFVDFGPRGLYPDGAVTLADGSLRVALWGEGGVISISPGGTLLDIDHLAAPHLTCPAYGGPDYTTQFCTSATSELTASERAAAPSSGMTFVSENAGQGRPEPAFLLSER